MRRLIAAAFCGVLALGAAASTAVAQDRAAEMQKNFDEKVSKPWFTENGFTADYDEALAKSKETGKPIFAYFTRSYSP